MDTTLDGLLNKRVQLEQPAKGYRVAVDTVLLASAVPAGAGQSVLDMGCGVGGVMLCLAARVSDLSVTGIECQKSLLDLCRRNWDRNHFQAKLTIIEGDVAELPATFFNSFDHVMMNPPYNEETKHDASPDLSKQKSNIEEEGLLRMWIEKAAVALCPTGILTLIHRADRLDEILDHARHSYSMFDILPIVTKSGSASKRVILRAYKQGQTRITRYRDLLLHQPDGQKTSEAEAILREAKPLEFIAL